MISFQIHFAVGSRNERPGITGISHLFEHMMFRGSKRFGPEEHNQIVQKNGGNSNAFTTTDNTTYFENLPSDKLEVAFDIESERLANLAITEDNLKTEREVVRNERKLRSVNSPYGLAEESLLAAAFEQHPYQWPVVGWDSDLRALTLADCKEYFRIYYAPNNATVVIAGDVQPERAIALAEKYFGPLKAQEPPPAVATYEKPQRGERRVVFKKVAQAPALFTVWHVPEWRHADTPVLEVLTAALTRGRSSRFYEKFIKPGLAGNADLALGIFWPTVDPSILELDVTANPGSDLAALEKGAYEEIDAIKKDGLTDAELAKVKKQLEASYYLRLQSVNARGVELGLLQVRTGDWKRINTRVASWRAVTNDDVKRVAAKYLTEDNRTVVTVIPTPSEASAAMGALE
jgi:predicted Zn-dependent peptidase